MTIGRCGKGFLSVVKIMRAKLEEHFNDDWSVLANGMALCKLRDSDGKIEVRHALLARAGSIHPRR